MCWLVQAVIIKRHRLGDLKNRNLLLGSEGQKPEIKVLAELLSSEASLLAAGCIPSVSLHMVFLCVCLCPHPVFLQGQQSCWIRAHPDDLILS